MDMRGQAPRPEWGREQLRRLNPDDVHHAHILVAKDVTVEDEVANVISTEIDKERDAGKWGGGWHFASHNGTWIMSRYWPVIAGAGWDPFILKLFCDFTRKCS